MTSARTNPLALIAELTHRCPLHCVYCSNPLELQNRANGRTTATWTRLFQEAAQAGVLQADLTGGEPLARTDIIELVRAARTAGLYVNLITSGMPLDEARLAKLIDAGLDHLQLSFQGATEEIAAEISGTKSHPQKLRVLDWLKRVRVAVTLNFVIHRNNIDQIDQMLALAESSSATRVEFANVQYYGWAFANRERLLPTRAQLDRSIETLKSAQERLRGKIRVENVAPDYYAKYPKPCMGGWGRKLMLITPTTPPPQNHPPHPPCPPPPPPAPPHPHHPTKKNPKPPPHPHHPKTPQRIRPPDAFPPPARQQRPDRLHAHEHRRVHRHDPSAQ